RTDGFAERSQDNTARRMNVTNRLNIGPHFVNPCMNPELCIGPTVAGQLIALDVELQKVIATHQSRTHARWKDKTIGARNPRADMTESRRDALLVENVAGSHNIFFNLVEIHVDILLNDCVPISLTSAPTKCLCAIIGQQSGHSHPLG